VQVEEDKPFRVSFRDVFRFSSSLRFDVSTFFGFDG
jgi:hypothetical protein